MLKFNFNKRIWIAFAVYVFISGVSGIPGDNITPSRPVMEPEKIIDAVTRPAPRPFQRRQVDTEQPDGDVETRWPITDDQAPLKTTPVERPDIQPVPGSEKVVRPPFDPGARRATHETIYDPGTETFIDAPAEADLSEPIGIKYANTSLEEVLKDYSDYTGRAIMKAPDVPNVSITLKCPRRIPKREALLAIETVLAMHGIGLVPMGDNFLKVVQLSVARKSGMATKTGALDSDYADTGHLVSQIIPIRHLELSDAQSTVQNLLHPSGNILPLQQINSLLVTDGAINIKRIFEILEHIDQPVEMREELRIFQIVHAKASEIQSKIEAIIAETDTRPTVPFIRRTIPVDPRRPRPPGPAPAPAVQQDDQEGMIKGKVKIVADDRTNTLIVITRPEQFDFLERMIKALDQQVEPDMSIKVYRLEYAKAEDILTVLTSLISSTAPETRMPPRPMQTPDQPRRPPEQAAPAPEQRDTISGTLSADVKVLSDARSNALIIMATRSDMKVIEDVLEKLDIMLKQVLIEVVILEIGLRDGRQTGVDWLQRSMIAYDQKADGGRRPILGFAGAGRVGTDGRIIEAASVRTVNNNPTGEGSGLSYFFSLYDLNIDAVVNMIASSTEARILSTPIILTTDNKEARIIVGEKRPIVTSTSISSGGTQQSAYQYTDIGIELTVTPHINQKGFVVMDVQQKVENVAGSEMIDGNRVPIIITREFGASIAVDDGKTIVVGGLASTDHSEDATKIPFLGDIPLLGRLFRSDQLSNQRRELLVMITPYVLGTPEDAHAQTKARREFMSDDKPMWENNWAQSEFAEKDEFKKQENRRWWKFWGRSTGKSRQAPEKAFQASEIVQDDIPEVADPAIEEGDHE